MQPRLERVRSPPGSEAAACRPEGALAATSPARPRCPPNLGQLHSPGSLRVLPRRCRGDAHAVSPRAEARTEYLVPVKRSEQPRPGRAPTVQALTALTTPPQTAGWAPARGGGKAPTWPSLRPVGPALEPRAAGRLRAVCGPCFPLKPDLTSAPVLGTTFAGRQGPPGAAGLRVPRVRADQGSSPKGPHRALKSLTEAFRGLITKTHFHRPAASGPGSWRPGSLGQPSGSQGWGGAAGRGGGESPLQFANPPAPGCRAPVRVCL